MLSTPMLGMEAAAAHGPLTRTHTAPSASHSRLNSGGGAGPSPLMQNQNHQSQYSNSSQSTYSIRSSNSTVNTRDTLGTYFPSPISSTATLTNGGPIEAADNVLNKRGDKEASLFQICINLMQRLRMVPGFQEYLVEEEEAADEDTDPVTVLWRTFRRGYPLMTIYNALNPATRLEVDESRVAEKKRGQAATFKFLQACLTELKFPAEECFIITDLYGDDTTGFVKVAKVVNRVLDILEQAGIIVSQQPQDTGAPGTGGKRSQREHIIDELVKTERTYVQHLELLQAFKKLVEERGIITGDAVHDIFLNLNALLDFQRRFLIRVEQTNAQSPDEQNWGKLFVLYKDAFRVYEPYIANQKKCEEVAMREYDKLRETGGPSEMRQMVESPTHLTSFLLKPFQRLSKYPLLLRELQKNGDLDDERKEDITTGIEAAQSILQRTNAAIDREERIEAVEELKRLVEDWKGHRIEGFGELLLFGTHTVLKGDAANTKDAEREYKIYLFEMILLCCKEIKPSKKGVVNKNAIDKRGKAKLQLKGRIFMQNVTETVSIGKPGSYTCQIFWKGDPGIENFIIRFATEEQMKRWANQVDQQRRIWKEASRTSSSSKQSKVDSTQFTYLRDQADLKNPYAQEEDDDDEEEEPYPGNAEYGMSRNDSSTSLRSRSATGDSGPPMVAPARFPTNAQSQPPLTLRTQQLQQHGAQNGDSYFSPMADSPLSSRTSSSSAGMYPFPRQGTPAGAYSGDEVGHRFTAPAPGRGVRPGEQQNGFPRVPVQRPSLPPHVGSQQSALAQNRLRSASSPDIQNPMAPRRGPPNMPVPDLPPFPTHYAYTPGIVNRSNNNSPNNPPVPQIPPQRTNTQSPNMPRGDRMMQRPGEFDYPTSAPRNDLRPAPLRTMTPASSDRTMTPVSTDSRTVSPPLPSSTPSNADFPIPSQLKVKVHCPTAGSTMTLVVSTNISFQSLKDRIDAKLQRSTSLSLASGQVKLKFLDEEDYVSIQSDEDVQTAFETWKEQHQAEQLMAGQLGEIELYCMG